jgi:hypothetical protein
MERDLPAGLNSAHPRLVAGPVAGFAIFALVVHFDLSRIEAECLDGEQDAIGIREQRTTQPRAEADSSHPLPNL